MRLETEVRIPRLFAEDHEAARELPSGDRVNVNKRYITYKANNTELVEWLDDARFYADEKYWRDASEFDEIKSIVNSAKRAVPNIVKAMIALEDDLIFTT